MSTDKCKYKSRYTDKDITIAQYLAEKMCERQAKKKKSELPWQFWNTTEWKRSFFLQLRAANGLLKTYKEEAITKALTLTPYVYSLNAPVLDSVIKTQEEKLERQVIKEPEIAPPPQCIIKDEKPRPSFSQTNSMSSKLDNL